jgi:hypothetical protein
VVTLAKKPHSALHSTCFQLLKGTAVDVIFFDGDLQHLWLEEQAGVWVLDAGQQQACSSSSSSSSEHSTAEAFDAACACAAAGNPAPLSGHHNTAAIAAVVLLCTSRHHALLHFTAAAATCSQLLKPTCWHGRLLLGSSMHSAALTLGLCMCMCLCCCWQSQARVKNPRQCGDGCSNDCTSPHHALLHFTAAAALYSQLDQNSTCWHALLLLLGSHVSSAGLTLGLCWAGWHDHFEARHVREKRLHALAVVVAAMAHGT